MRYGKRLSPKLVRRVFVFFILHILNEKKKEENLPSLTRKTSTLLKEDAKHVSRRPAFGDDEVRVWLTVPSSALLEPLMSSSAAALGCRSSKKKTVHFALPGRVIRPLQWRDDVIWARVEPIKGRRHATSTGGHLFQPPATESSPTTEDNQSSSSGDSVPSKNDSSELSSMTEGSPLPPPSARGQDQRTGGSGDVPAALAFAQRLQCSECVQCALMEDAVQRLEASRREAGLKLRSYEAQIRSLQQASSRVFWRKQRSSIRWLVSGIVAVTSAARESVGVRTRHSFSTTLVLSRPAGRPLSVAQACCSAEATLRDEKALHAVTRQELGRVLDRLKFYTGSRIASSSSSSSAALKDYRALRNTTNTSQTPCLSSAQWNRTFRKNRAGMKVCESKCQHIISIQQTRGSHNSDIGVQVNLLARSIDDRPKLSAKMRYGIAAVFQDKSSCKTLPANAGRGTRISKPLRGVITEREAALGILSREVKLLQEERDHLQELLQHSLQGVVPQHAAHVAKGLQEQIEALKAENQRLLDSYNAERVMRKK
ncbi:uncharacterized protein LOC119387124 [Rhipicephalus sanguineus]|uniref:uncharacterized protein LOC119387124 n=1 Tax=Rhipicephalus sanguineus TaxID=34632 RepID=UPI0020C1DE9B|nr:uncharacterized protein LOC119387124 [Rhipicephalus sanguineus]